MSSYVSSAADSLLPYSPAFSTPSVPPFQYNSPSSLDVLPSSWPHAPLVAAALMYQNEYHYRSIGNRKEVPQRLQPEGAAAGGTDNHTSPLPLEIQEQRGSSNKNATSQLSTKATATATATASKFTSSFSEDDSRPTLGCSRLLSAISQGTEKGLEPNGVESRSNQLRVENGEYKKGGASISDHLDDEARYGNSVLCQGQPASACGHVEGDVDGSVQQKDAHAAAIPVDEVTSGLQVKSKLSPEVPEFVPRPAPTTFLSASNLQCTSKGSKSQQLSADVPEFVPMSASALPTSIPFITHGTVSDLQNSLGGGLQGPPSAPPNSKSTDIARSSKPVLLNAVAIANSKKTVAGFPASAVLNHTSPSFMSSPAAGNITAATVLTVASHSGIAVSGQGLTAVLIPNSVLQGSSLLLSTLPVSSTRVPVLNVTGQALGMASSTTASFMLESTSGTLVSGVPGHVPGQHNAEKTTGKPFVFTAPTPGSRPTEVGAQSPADAVQSKVDKRGAIGDATNSAIQAGAISAGRQASFLKNSFPNSTRKVPPPAGSKLSSSSPEFVPSAMLGVSSAQAVAGNHKGKSSMQEGGVREFAGRSVSYTAGSQTKLPLVRTVDNANDSSRLSPTAPTFAPRKGTGSTEGGRRELLSVRLPAEDTLLEVSPVLALDTEGTLLESAAVRMKRKDGSVSHLSPAAPEFTPTTEETKGFERGKRDGPQTARDINGGRVPTKQELQVIVKLVGELKSSGDSAHGGATAKFLGDQKDGDRSKGVERLRRALLQHLAQQALLQADEADVASQERTGQGKGCMDKSPRSGSGLRRGSKDPTEATCRQSLSAAAKEFVPTVGSTDLVNEMAFLDPDTLSTSSCDPLLFMEGLAKAAAQSSSSKQSSRFFPTAATASLTGLQCSSSPHY